MTTSVTLYWIKVKLREYRLNTCYVHNVNLSSLKQPRRPVDDAVVQPVQRPHRVVVLRHEHHLQRAAHRGGGRRRQVE